MLWAAYGLLGLGMRDGQPRLNTVLLEAGGPLRLRRVWVHGKEVFVRNTEDGSDD